MNADAASHALAISAGADDAERAEDLFLRWLLRLPLDADPSSAARLALDAVPSRPNDR